MLLIGRHTNKLVDAIHDKDWTSLIGICSDHPGMAKRWCRVKLGENGPRHALLPLHYAVLLSDGTDEFLAAVSALVDAYPQALECKVSSLHRTPLHLACLRDNTPPSLIAMLLERNAGVATMKDHFERLPIHYLAGTNKLEAIEYLLEAYPEACTVRDGQGWLPLHVACHYNSEFRTVQVLLQANPDAVIAITPLDRDTPLNLVEKQQPFRDQHEIMDLLREKEAYYVPTPKPYIDSFVTDNFIHPLY